MKYVRMLFRCLFYYVVNPNMGLRDSTRACAATNPWKLGDESMVSVKTESLFIAIASTCQRSDLSTHHHVSIERCWLYYDERRERSPASWLFDMLWGLSIWKRPQAPDSNSKSSSASFAKSHELCFKACGPLIQSKKTCHPSRLDQIICILTGI